MFPRFAISRLSRSSKLGFTLKRFLQLSSVVNQEQAFRIETDSFGEMKVPCDKYYGAQTVRSTINFPMGGSGEEMPKPIVLAMAMVKKASALANKDLGMDAKIADAICCACDELISGDLYEGNFLAIIWQTHTITNMNCNEVISNRANEMLGGELGSKTPVHPNDHVNKAQSSNCNYPTALNVATVLELKNKLIPAITELMNALEKKRQEFNDIVKIGRTHLMDATPLTMGQEFSGYVQQLKYSLDRINTCFPRLYEVPIGGTAVGTGITAQVGFAEKAAGYLAEQTGLPFVKCPNAFEAQANRDCIVEVAGILNTVAASLNKIAADIRIMGSGPRCGMAELSLPENEPGSSIMPGKVNPTQCDAINMLCCQVFGNSLATVLGGASGQLEMSGYQPVIGANVMRSINLLTNGCRSFTNHCVVGLKANKKRIEELLNNSLMLVTALNNHIGYDKSAQIAKTAHKNGTTLKEEAIKSGFVTEEQFKQWVVPKDMVNPDK